MKFKLIKKSADQVLTRFQVLDGEGSICGSINVQNQDVSDLLKCWSGAAESPSPKQSPTKALANAFLRSKSKQPVSQQAILRGC
jgi:hypothetical protein